MRLKSLPKSSQHTATSTGVVIWPGAEILCAFICANEQMFKAKTVLELGSGVGLCAICAAYVSAKVVASDGDQSSLQLLRENIREHFLQHPSISAPEVRTLLWGNQSDVMEKFSVIIGADIT